jgi:hypothetical protein
MTQERTSPRASSTPRARLVALALTFAAAGFAPAACGITVGVDGAPDGGTTSDGAAPPSATTAPPSSASASATATGTSTPPGVPGPKVHVVLFTHIEDNTPMGPLDAPQARVSYMNIRARVVEMGKLANAHKVAWSFQPDWKILVAAKRFEDAQTMASTGGKNFLVYLRDTLGVFVDPHAHENNGYNYPDVAYLLTDLGVGGSTVVGGHVWDPSLPQFAEWDRFRAPVAGLMFPSFTWRGDILMGSGTPNHVNDPIVSGVWRPKDRNAYFVDEPTGNVAAVGAYTKGLEGVTELVGKYASGEVPASCMLTSSYHVAPAALLAPDGIAAIERDVLAPLEAHANAGKVVLTDFTSLVATWKRDYGAKACLYPTPK